jgi:hypothetical protein
VVLRPKKLEMIMWKDYMILKFKMSFQTNEIPELSYPPTQSSNFGIKIYVIGAVSPV